MFIRPYVDPDTSYYFYKIFSAKKSPENIQIFGIDVNKLKLSKKGNIWGILAKNDSS